jgi:hypothetical protein
VGQIFDRRLAVDPGEEQSGQQAGGARLEAARLFPVDACEIGRGERSEGSEIGRLADALAGALQQKMV